MRHFFFSVLLLVALVPFASAQKVISLYNGRAPGSEKWDWQEKETYNEMTKQNLVYNVSQPTLTVYAPEAGTSNGTAVVIAPGGGFHILSIDNEGINVAKWLAAKGVTAFVLKYRLVKSVTNDPFMEMMQFIQSGKADSMHLTVFDMSVKDGIEAMTYVRAHAADFAIDPKRIGIMGFSAGGTVAAGVTLKYTTESRPDFSAPIYAYLGSFSNTQPQKDAPPLFLAAASDDQLGLAVPSLAMYTNWIKAGKSAEMHIYAKGGHGFGIKKQNIPTDSWIDRFGDWLDGQGLLKPGKK